MLGMFVPAPLPSPAATVVQSPDGSTLTSQAARTPLGSPPITMSWVGQSFAATGGIAGHAPREDRSGLPPEYSAVRAPTTRMEYTFSPNGSNSMLVLPPSDAPDTRPLYHISSWLDPFIPTAGVTTVCRGGHADGAFVGSFEWGLTRAVPTITYGSQEAECPGVIRVVHGMAHPAFTWQWTENVKLYWLVEGSVAKCYVNDRFPRPLPSAEPLAIFAGRQIRLPSEQRRHPLRALQVYPRAHHGQLLDHIILGALLLERRRLSPWADREGDFVIGTRV